MPWYFPWSEAIKKRACRYLLQRYLGQFLQHKLTLEQLSLDLYSGKGLVKDVALDVEVINETFKAANLPFEIVDGFVGTFSVEIPWSALLSESTLVEVQGLEVTLKPKTAHDGSAMLDSMWGSMTKSSMQLAEECLKEEERTKRLQPASQFEGLEKFAQAIDIVLTRVKVDFSDIVIRLEQMQSGSNSKAIALEARIKKLRYFDESEVIPASDSGEVIYQPLSIANKCFHIEGLTIYSDEYSLKPVLRPTRMPSEEFSSSSLQNSELFYSTIDLSSSQDAQTERTGNESASQDNEGSQSNTPVLSRQTSVHRSVASNTNLVQIAVCHGITEVRVKVKQNAEISGPKFELDGHVGSLHAFLWPKQLELLRGLFGELFDKRIADLKSNVQSQKAMTNSDYAKIEHELQRTFESKQASNRGGNNIQRAVWEDFTTSKSSDDEFHALEPRTALQDSTTGMLSGKHTPTGSVADYTTTTNAGKFHVKSLFLTLVEEDLEGSSFADMQRLTAEHFHSLTDAEEWDLHNVLGLRDKFARSTPVSHLWLHASRVVAEGKEKVSSNSTTITSRISLGTCEVWEHLFGLQDSVASVSSESVYLLKTAPICMELLTFPNRSQEERLSFVPSVVIDYQSTESNRSNQPAQNATNSVRISLQAARTDLDITVIDRLHTLLTAINPSRKVEAKRWEDGLRSTAEAKQPIEVSLMCESLTINVRFPVLDLRPAVDRSGLRERSLQKEFLVAVLDGFRVKFLLDHHLSKRIDFDCRGLTAGLQLLQDEKPVMFLESVRDVDVNLDERRREEFAECPKMSIYTTVFPVSAMGFTSNDDPSFRSRLGSLDGLIDSAEKEPSLFSVQRNMVDHEEINCVTPSSTTESAAFRDDVMRHSELRIDVSIPNVSIFLPDKNLLEILYNRINTDLLLWEPSFPKSRADSIPLSAANLLDSRGFPHYGVPNTFGMCGEFSSQDRYESASDNSDGDEEADLSNQHFNRLFGMSQSVRGQAMLPSTACFTLSVAKASIGAVVENLNEELTSLPHMAWVDVANAKIFSVTGYRGQPEIRYSAISVHRAKLFFGELPEASKVSLQQAFRRPIHELPVVIEPATEDLIASNLESKDVPMLNVAIAIHVDTFRNVKDIKVALELGRVKLNHRMSTPDNFWLTQMIDYVNLKDFAVLGYNCPTIITQFHLNVVNSVLSYDPLYLALSTLVTVEQLNISSNIVADSPQSLMRVISQDLRLHLSKKKADHTSNESLHSPAKVTRRESRSLRKDYVCVMDIPFVEFQMKLTDGSNPKFPRFDFRASNNCCYLRTCADSCRELSGLIQYLVDYGDMNPPNNSSVRSHASSNDGGVPAPSVNEETVIDEMIEAMSDVNASRNPKDMMSRSMHVPSVGASAKARHSMAATISSASVMFNDRHVDDDGFCIIEDDLGVGIALKNGEPSVKFLTPDPIRIVENHFELPLAITDQLKAPKSYPVPVIRLALREMSLVWCLYGGKDFEQSAITQTKKIGPQNRQNSAPAKLNDSKSFGSQADADQQSRSPSWLRQGGPGRDHSVLMEIHLNKVKFQHEQYPFDGKSIHAARQVLFIQDFDIRDRLAASQINKFLYQHVSNSLPKQTHASMFAIKAFHERPDPELPMQECTLKISVQPLRLNVDQESLFFLNDFFAEVSGTSSKNRLANSGQPGAEGNRSRNNSAEQPPVSRRSRLESLSEEEPNSSLGVQDPLIRFDDVGPPPLTVPEDLPPVDLDRTSTTFSETNSVPIFFKSVEFSPEVPIRLDYHGKYVDMERVGAFGGLLVGLAQLKCSMLRLKRVHSRQGIRGFDRLILFLLSEWLDDIRKTQLANLLGGIGPVHCLVQLVQGIRDLFWLPVEQYRKDGRIVRGVQRGATAFTTSTLIATIELTNRIVQTVQVAAESAYDVISPGPSFRRRRKMAVHVVAPHPQPGDIREGVVTAYQVLCEGFSDTAREMIEAVNDERDQKGMTGAVGGALRQIGPAIVKPIILASQATSNVLGGIRNQLQPENRQDEIEKWRTEDDIRNPGTQAKR